MAEVDFNDLTAASGIDGSADYWPINQGATTKKINRETMLGVTGSPADTSTAQSFTNKTLNNTNTLTLRDDRFTLQDNGDTTKQVQFNLTDIGAATTRTFRFPNVNDILVTESATQGMTNKTLTGPTISGGSIDNSTVTVDSIGEHTAANGVTIDGLNIKDSKLNTNNSVVSANITDSAVTPAKLLSGTGSTWAWQFWTTTWTQLTIGNATTTYAYSQIGKLVILVIRVVFGNTTSMGTNPTFTLPVTASANFNAALLPIGSATIEDSGTATFKGYVAIASTTTGRIYVEKADSTYVTADTQLTSSVPMIWTTNDAIRLTAMYEAL